MSAPRPLPPNVTRSYIPFLGDVVTVSNPAILRALSTHPHIARPDQASLPFPVAFLLRATQFTSSLLHTTDYAVAFTTTDNNDQARRRRRVLTNLAHSLSTDDIAFLHTLVSDDTDLYPAARAIVQRLAPRILGLRPLEHVPEHVLDSLPDMDLNYILNPLRYIRARRARAVVLQWAALRFPHESHPVDIAHDLVTLYHGFTTGLLGLRRRQPGDDLATHLGKNPILPVSLRVPNCTTTVDGIFEQPLVKDSTIIIVDIGTAATETLDLAFVFGMGTQDRQCPFRHMFVDSAKRVLQMEQAVEEQTTATSQPMLALSG